MLYFQLVRGVEGWRDCGGVAGIWRRSGVRGGLARWVEAGFRLCRGAFPRFGAVSGESRGWFGGHYEGCGNEPRLRLFWGVGAFCGSGRPDLRGIRHDTCCSKVQDTQSVLQPPQRGQLESETQAAQASEMLSVSQIRTAIFALRYHFSTKVGSRGGFSDGPAPYLMKTLIQCSRSSSAALFYCSLYGQFL
jgi:hypothetical protein